MVAWSKAKANTALHTTAASVAVLERGSFSCSIENRAGSVGGV